MGADIHFYIEKKKRDGKWHLAECHHVEHEQYDGESCVYISDYSPGRNYVFFGLLANVRGAPGEHTIPDRGVPKDVCPELKELVDQWDCDAHSRSHCTISEYEAVCDELKEYCSQYGDRDYSEAWREALKYAIDWLSTEAAEAALLDDPYEPEVRFVYFFDN